MAKKSPSAAKKTKSAKAKTSVKAVKKLIVKPAKPAKKVASAATKKTTKASPVATKSNVKSTLTKTEKPKEIQKAAASKPALMTKKGKADPVAEVVDEVVAVAAEAVTTKAEKVSKVKPIRIEKGNLDDEKAKWSELFKKYGKDKAILYKMSDTFPSLSPVQHKVLGWGFILKNDNDRLEVLFETGIRMLISNYKS